MARVEDSLGELIGYRLRRASAVMMADLARVLAPLGLRMITYSALRVVCARPGLTQAALAEGLDIERSNLVAILDEMEVADWIERAPAAGDRRAHALRVTDTGARLLEEASGVVAAHEARMTAGLSEEECAALRAALMRIEEAGA